MDHRPGWRHPQLAQPAGRAEGFRHSVQIDDHELFADVPRSAGGEGSAPEPHDYFDAALGACKALTLTMYAKKKGTEVSVETHLSEGAFSQ
ncbi:OsmC family protein [Pseudomonas sp. RT4P38]